MPFSYEPEYTYDDDSYSRSDARRSAGVRVKKLPTLGGMNQSFDPNARDGDGDGLVQEGTAFERPATPIAEAGQAVRAVASKPSTTGGTSGQVRAVGNVPGGMQRPTIPVAPKERRPLLPMFRARPKKGSPYNDIYGHPLRFKGMSSKQIAEKSVPTSVEEMLAMSVEHYVGDKETWLARHIAKGENVNEQDYYVAVGKATAKIAGRWQEMQTKMDTAHQMVQRGQMTKAEYSKLADEDGWMKPDFSPETVALMRREVQKAIDESPEFRFACENFGVPPYVAADTDRFFDGTRHDRGWNGLHNPSVRLVTLDSYRMRKRADQDRESIPNQEYRGRWTIDPTNQGIIRHEFGHWMATQLRQKGESMYFDRGDADPTQYQPYVARYVALHNQFGNDPVSVKLLSDANAQDIPFVLSMYGRKNNAEMLAESFAAYTSPEQGDKKRISNAARQLIEGVLGVGSGKPYPWAEEETSKRTLMRGRGVRASERMPETTGVKSIADWERPIVTQVRKTSDDEMEHRVTLGDHTFAWEAPIDPFDDLAQRSRIRDAESHFDTESFNGAVKHGGDAWFNREVSALMFGYAPSEPDFIDYGKRGLKAGNPEFSAIATGEASKLSDEDKDDVQNALERAFNVMQAIADEPTKDTPLFRLVSDTDMFKEGDVVPVPTTNFANNISDLPDSVLGDHYVSRGQVSTGGAILKITGPHHSFSNGKESITQGNFRIKSISVDDNGNKVIEMEQVETFSPRANAFKSVVTEGQAAMRALGSRTPINV